MPFIATCVDAIGTVFWDRPQLTMADPVTVMQVTYKGQRGEMFFSLVRNNWQVFLSFSEILVNMSTYVSQVYYIIMNKQAILWCGFRHSLSTTAAGMNHVCIMLVTTEFEGST